MDRGRDGDEPRFELVACDGEAGAPGGVEVPGQRRRARRRCRRPVGRPGGGARGGDRVGPAGLVFGEGWPRRRDDRVGAARSRRSGRRGPDIKMPDGLSHVTSLQVPYHGTDVPSTQRRIAATVRSIALRRGGRMFVNRMPRYEILSADAMEILDRGWRRIVSEIGVEFMSP